MTHLMIVLMAASAVLLTMLVAGDGALLLVAGVDPES